MTTTKPKPEPPAGLRTRGRAYWADVTATYGLSTSELLLLVEACRTIDALDVLAEQVTADGPMVAGSAGQPVVHPALTEARGQRVVLHRLIAALALPDPTGASVPSTTSMRSRVASRARWSP